MRWEVWEPWYLRIAERLGLDREEDERAVRLLSDFFPPPELEGLRGKLRGRECLVLGAGPSLEEDLRRLERAGRLGMTILSADGATSAAMRFRSPDVVVTDLDGKVEDQEEVWRRGSWLVIHVHGDNYARVREFLRGKEPVRLLGTTQLRPTGNLLNFGGFTDGDRAAFLAWELGARRIYLAGMDLGEEVGEYSGKKGGERKREKLRICGELLSWLAGELGAPLVNLTSGGVEIPHVPRESLKP
ncbi:MAG: 6-hydroxymethylpterin diphosphokinase MptE-like protein [Candidatus Hadarchaeales archaeon]